MLENVLFASPQQTETVSVKTRNKDNYRWKYVPKKFYKDFEQRIEAAPLCILVCTYLNYFVLILFGHLRDILGKFFKPDQYTHLKTSKVNHLQVYLKHSFN